MNARNFDKIMQSQAEAAGENATLLLHCCCAPCSTACIERLKDYFKITVLFYNPNIEADEYERRKTELKRFISVTGFAQFMDCDRENEMFYKAVKGLENEPEGGARCKKCFELRLEKTARIADENGYGYFATTLTVSPLKNAAVINAIGESVQKSAKWLYSDFKKRDGYLRSVRLSGEYGLYRQDYCGCVYSRRQNSSTADARKNCDRADGKLQET